MTPHPYTEDQLVEQPAIGLFAELGWTTVLAMEEEFGPQGTLQRDGKADVVLLSRLTIAKKDETRQRRLATLIACSAKGERIGPLRRNYLANTPAAGLA